MVKCLICQTDCINSLAPYIREMYCPYHNFFRYETHWIITDYEKRICFWYFVDKEERAQIIAKRNGITKDSYINIELTGTEQEAMKQYNKYILLL